MTNVGLISSQPSDSASRDKP